MTKMRHFKAGTGAWGRWKDEPGTRIARLVGTKLSKTIGAGVLELERAAVPSSIDFDEIIVVLEGPFVSRSNGEVFTCGPGDVLWIPKGTSFTLESTSKAKVCYIRYPLDGTQAGEG